MDDQIIIKQNDLIQKIKSDNSTITKILHIKILEINKLKLVVKNYELANTQESALAQ
jgi:hypothetical protein